MINLLIVDNEIFTREGIIEMLPLEALGITHTRQAYDGIDALNVAKEFVPDILLTDVRMPRMDGIELAFEIRKLYPDCSIIFMSGYSDKEYLKAAITLKAITYVEKPIELDELETAVKNAILENSKSKTLNDSIENKIASEISKDYYNHNIEDIINSFISKEMRDALNKAFFLTVSLKMQTPIKTSNEGIIRSIKGICSLYCFSSFVSIKDENEIILHLFFTKNDKDYINLQSTLYNALFISIGEYLSKHSNYYICVGKIVPKINEVSTSYEIASKMCTYTFFYDYNSIILPSDNITSNYMMNETIYNEFDKYLHKEDKQNLILIIKNLTSEIRKFPGTSASSIKDIYYRLCLKIFEFSVDRNISTNENMNSNHVFDEILKCPNIFVLENFLIDKINEFFIILNEKTSKNNPVLSVLEYIHNNYSDPNLCLEQISKNTYLTPAYICVIFKDYTSTTVNKYINEYRIEKSKLFLKDSNIKMGDVAEKVGYSDGNYFSKIFRKATSYSPSEYRRHFSK
ncbi:response regulator transcription factor [Inconstantimicrobium mannanitabidum]|uniref:DNA-binding response regulator n=1 Tax=Inconstantimicrobium mannanitabidum TaxID=1604901 RepID=A0ACB5RA95_9CLOT|nr:response regulator [Clostridium sp. TW13]GKX65784.1 DNA-binding response regulator [Clostridium sp. TW13]